ncbi:hypothetical protein GCM10029978_089980 [Actinoallomurus acanthiterrae]
MFREVSRIATVRGAKTTSDRLDAARQRLERGQLTVMVFGEFKRGKSSLLNALLGEVTEPVLFPVFEDIATNTVTTVTHGDRERIEILLSGTADDTTREIREITRAEIARYVTESANPHNTKHVEAVRIETPNPRLASGLTLMDTPGVGGIYEAHTAVALAFLPTADAIIFVVDATQPLLNSEIEFLRSAAHAITDTDDAFIFVLTKIDAEADYQELMANDLAQLSETIGHPAKQLRIVPVSSNAHRDYLLDGDEEDLFLGNFAQLEEVLWSTLARRRVRTLLGGALRDLDASAQSLMRPLDEELAALTTTAAGELEQLGVEARLRRERLDAMGRDQATWREELAEELRLLGRRCKRIAATGLEELWLRIRAGYLYDKELLRDPERLMGRIAADAAALAASVGERAARDAAMLQQEFTRRSGVDLGPAHMGSLPAPPVPGLTLDAWLGGTEQNWRPRQLFSVAGDLSGAAALGALLGSFLGPAGIGFGGVLGQIAGIVVGYRKALAAAEQAEFEARRRAVQDELAPVRRALELHILESLDDLIASYERATIRELDGRIAQERESAEDALHRIESTRAATADEAERQHAKLETERAPLLLLRDRIAAHVTSVEELWRATGAMGHAE